MKAMILAAGEGTRLRPITYETPKSCIPINGKPLLAYNLELLKKYNITDIAINVSHLADKVIEEFKDGSNYGVKLTYSKEEELLGTAGAVKKIESFFDSAFVLIYGDLLTNIDLNKLIEFHNQHKGIATVALYKVPRPEACGVVELDGDRITKFIEKPEHPDTNLVNAGVYVLETEIFKYIPKNKFFDFGLDLFPVLLNEGNQIFGYEINEYLIDIGTKEKLEKAEKDIKEGKIE